MCRNLSIYYTFVRSEGPKTDPESVRTSTSARDGGKNGKKRQGMADGTGRFGPGPDFCRFCPPGRVPKFRRNRSGETCFFLVFSRCVACPLKRPQGRPREAPGRPRGPFLVRLLVDFWTLFGRFFQHFLESFSNSLHLLRNFHEISLAPNAVIGATMDS